MYVFSEISKDIQFKSSLTTFSGVTNASDSCLEI
jgi:hypothetical protein